MIKTDILKIYSISIAFICLLFSCTEADLEEEGLEEACTFNFESILRYDYDSGDLPINNQLFIAPNFANISPSTSPQAYNLSNLVRVYKDNIHQAFEKEFRLGRFDCTVTDFGFQLVDNPTVGLFSEVREYYYDEADRYRQYTNYVYTRGDSVTTEMYEKKDHSDGCSFSRVYDIDEERYIEYTTCFTRNATNDYFVTQNIPIELLDFEEVFRTEMEFNADGSGSLREFEKTNDFVGTIEVLARRVLWNADGSGTYLNYLDNSENTAW